MDVLEFLEVSGGLCYDTLEAEWGRADTGQSGGRGEDGDGKICKAGHIAS